MENEEDKNIPEKPHPPRIRLKKDVPLFLIPLGFLPIAMIIFFIIAFVRC
ncbi:MAG: hypothetical protein HYW78_02585 [Parcubacteria group bacterium]|nr:hypothetical protein [Parcubacteria group bacterium]